jgi:prolyl-tRNA editing enzyme YbaK/EbsC (Cys-tRNA(Pro) deacylase)
MKDALAIHRWLLAHQVHHEILRLPRPLAGASDLPAALGVPPGNCLMVSVFQVTTRVDREIVAVVTAVDGPPVPGVIGTLRGAREIRPAPAFVTNAATDYAAELVCPLLLPEELTVLLDQRLADALTGDEPVYTATGERHTALRIGAGALFGLTDAKTVDIQPRSRTPIPSSR